MSNRKEAGSPHRREEGSNAGCLALQSGEEVTKRADTPPVMFLTPPAAVMPDRDRDGIPDVLDCQPSNPYEDGFWGDVSARLRSAWRRAPVHVSYARAARRRATVRRAAVSTGRRVTRRVTTAAREAVRRAPIHVSPARAVRRRAAVREGVTRIARPVVGRAVTTAVPLVGVAAIVHRAAVGARPTIEAAVTRTKEMIRVSPARVEAQARTEQQKYDRMVGAYKAKYPDPSKPVSEAEYKRAAADYRAIQTQEQIMKTAREKTTTAGAERYLAEQQVKAPAMGEGVRWFAEKTARVAAVARGFEKPVEERMLAAEKRLGLHAEWIPKPIKTAGWGVKELGYGIAFTGTAGAVEMAGMVPGGIDVLRKKPSIVAPAAIYGTYIMGKGAYEAVKKSPTRFAGELIAFGAVTKGAGIVAKPITPTIIHGTGYVGVGLKGFRKPTYKAIDVKVTPKEFLRSQIAVGKIVGVRHKPVTVRPGEKPLGTARIDIGEPAAITKPTQIYISPKTYAYSALRKVADPLMKVTRADIYQQRAFRAKYPTRHEVLAHELIHHKFPQFSEGKVMRMTREFGEIPSKKMFTIPKRIKTGYVREPIPLIGVRTKLGIPAIEGITSTYRGLVIGRRWTPVEYYKAAKIDVTTTPEGTIFEARRGMQVRLGKLRYEKEAIARGVEKGGYFLPEAKAPIKPAFPELTTAEKGIIPLEPGKFPLSTEVIAPKPLKPTRIYGEVRRPYMKAGDISMFGSKARMRWLEIGERRLMYGIEGAPKQPKIIIKADAWRYRPTFPPSFGLRAGKAPTPPATVTGYAPKQIPPDIFFKTTAVAPSSRFFDIGHFMRPVKAKPIVEVPPIKPRGVPERIIPTPEAMPRVARVTYAEPTVCVGGVCFRDVGIPQLQRVLPITPRVKPKVTYAEPPKPDPRLQRLLDMDVALERKPIPSIKPKPTVEDIIGRVKPIVKGRVLVAPKVKTPPRPKVRAGERITWWGLRPPSFEEEGIPTPIITPFTPTTPTPMKKEEDRYKMMPTHIPKPKVITKTVTEPTPYPEIVPPPVPVPVPVPKTVPPPIPEPKYERFPPPPIKPIIPPEPRILFIPTGEDEKKRRRKIRGTRGMFKWGVKNPIRAFFGEAGKDLKSVVGGR